MVAVVERLSKLTDTLVGIVSPRRQLLREMIRSNSKFRSYSGASGERMLRDWMTSDDSADSDLKFDLDTLRERSRDLLRNDGIAVGVQRAFDDNVVGSGLRPKPTLSAENSDFSAGRVKKINDAQRRIWDAWQENADSTDHLDFYELQGLFLREKVATGDGIAKLTKVNNRKRYGFGVEVIDAAQLQTPQEHENQRNIRMGVELGDRQQPIRYFFLKKQESDRRDFSVPADPRREHLAIPTRDEFGLKRVYHWFDRGRIQTRGAPLLSPVLQIFRYLNKHVESESVAHRVAACFAILVESNNPMADLEALSTDKNGNRLEELEPGIFHYGNAGEKFQVAAPRNVGSEFLTFVDFVIRIIGVSCGLSYGAIMRHSMENFSNSRTEIMGDRKTYKCMRKGLVRCFCDPVYLRVMHQAFRAGDLPDFAPDPTLQPMIYKQDWIAEGWDWVDPEKDAKTAKMELEMGLTSRQRMAREKGRDFHAIHRELEEEKAMGYDANEEQGEATSATSD